MTNRASVPRGTLPPISPSNPSIGVIDPAATLERGLAEIGLGVVESRAPVLLELARLVDRWGSRINLTGHRGLDAIIRRLVLESCALVAVIPETPTLVDLGSGAGFPGLPAAILRPGCHVTLVESRERRHHFQRAACRALGIENATPLRGRAEELEAAPHAAAIAQAMARPDAAVRLMLRWVEIGGLVLLPGTAEATFVPEPRIRAERSVDYRVPLGGPRRTLSIARRVA